MRECSRISHQHFGSDPTAKRSADKYGAIELQMFCQVEVKISKVADLSQRIRPAPEAEAWMPRRQHPKMRRQLEQMAIRRGVQLLTAVEEQERPAFAEHHDIQRNT